MTSAISTHVRGWTVVFAALAINLLLGVLYAWSVMAKALVVQWHWQATEAALPFTVSAAAFAITMIFAGRWQDKIGPRLVAMVGGTILGAGLIASSFATTPVVMVTTFGLIGGMGIGIGYSATTPPAIKWFPPERKGLIAGIVVSGVGLAAVYIAPLTQYLLRIGNIPRTFVILGIGTVILVALLSQLLANPPSTPSPAANGPRRPTAPRPELMWRAMLRTPQFYQLWLMFVLAASAGLMIISQVALIAKEQAHIDRWGFAPVATLALFNTLGRVLGGFLSDRTSRSSTMALAFLLQAANLFCFAHYTSPALFIFGVAFTGVCYGTLFSLFPATTADFYGLRYLGGNYGLVFTAFGIAGILGPLLGARIRDILHSYSYAYGISATMLLLGTVLAFKLKHPRLNANLPATATALTGMEQEPTPVSKS